MSYKTEQEKFWAGEFGRDYIERNTLTPEQYAASTYLWAKILGSMSTSPCSILELGSNIGNNLHVLNDLVPNARLGAVEINPVAADAVRSWGKAEVFEASILEFSPGESWEMVFTCGVLIHINPDALSAVYDLIYKASSKYICMSEYYSPRPDEVSYRGHSERMYRRDFAGEIMDKYPDLKLVSYGFAYHRDPLFPLGDLTWFLMEKTS